MYKAIIKAVMIISICISTAFAGTQQYVTKKTLSFAVHEWKSDSLIDVVTIQMGVDNLTRNVFITVDKHCTAGIKIQNCGNVRQVNPGSAVLCQLSNLNPTISFYAEKRAFVQGTYQIESP